MSLLKKLGKVIGKVATGNILGAVGTVAGAIIGSKGSKKSSGTQASSYDAAAQEQRNALMRAEGYQQPYMQLGTSGIDSLNKLNAGDYSAFNNSPDYKYALQQGLAGVEGSAAARGGLYSGNAMRALQETGSGLASQNLGNYRNSLFQTIGVGQGAANNLTSASLDTAGNVGNAVIGAGDARASGIEGSTNAITTAINDFSYNGGRKKKPVSAAYQTYGVDFNKRPNYNSLTG